MASRKLKGSGVLEGISIPEKFRGKFVCICDGKVMDARDITADIDNGETIPLFLGIPEDDHAIAAF
jgi:hypothetical protein